MADDYGQKIPVEITTSTMFLDKQNLSKSRYILGSIFCDYETDADIEVTIYYRRNNKLEWESLSPITLLKENKRYFQKLPNMGAVIDFYVKINTTVTSFILTSFKVFIKSKTTGKFS